jgi:thymidine kinase
MLDGKPVYSGEQIQIGGNESYYPVCRKHYHHPPVEIVEKGGEQ